MLTEMYKHCDGKYELRNRTKTRGGDALIGIDSNMTAFYASKEVAFIFAMLTKSLISLLIT